MHVLVVGYVGNIEQYLYLILTRTVTKTLLQGGRGPQGGQCKHGADV